MDEAVTPLPRPLTTPPVTRIYFMMPNYLNEIKRLRTSATKGGYEPWLPCMWRQDPRGGARGWGSKFRPVLTDVHK